VSKEDKEERDRMIVLLALCKLMKIETRAGLVYGALQDAEDEVARFDRATNEDSLNPRP
jgi:hypothetical protein